MNEREEIKRKCSKSDSKGKAETKEKIYSDVNGSYTGRPVDGREPEQDADDL